MRDVRVRFFGRRLLDASCLAAVAAAAAVPLAGTNWAADLLANVSVYTMALTLALAVGAWMLNRRMLVAGLICLLPIHALGVMRPRAPHAVDNPDLRLLIHNTHSFNDDVEQITRSLLASGADIVVLVDVSPEFVRHLRSTTVLAETYPHELRSGPLPGVTGWRLILSRWALSERGGEDELACIVGRPAGPFAVIALHPASPRDGGRWRRGNALVDEAAGLARRLADEGLPVIVAGDLNSTPSGWRDRLLARNAPLRRCKPRMAGGTFPAALPGVLRLALDDAWVSPGWRVVSWRLGPGAGSDHASVVVELALTPSGGPPPANR